DVEPAPETQVADTNTSDESESDNNNDSNSNSSDQDENSTSNNDDNTNTDRGSDNNSSSSSDSGNSSKSSSDSSSSNDDKTETKSEPKEEKKAPAQNGDISTVVDAGFAHLGTPYVWGGKSPSGFDCSGFVSWAFSQAGISVPSYTGGLAGTGSKVSTSSMQPGDIVFFDTYKTNGHVGIYLGGGQFIGAQNSTGLAVADMSSGYWADNFNGHVRRVQ